MKQDMELIPFEDLLTEFYGEIGTIQREEHERRVAEAIRASVKENGKCKTGGTIHNVVDI